MELRHLRYFVAVAQELNFTRAAARLGIAQPPLSQQISRLEQDLGVKLFTRGARGVQLTNAGAMLLTEAQALLTRAEETRMAVRWHGAGVAGSLRIASVASGFSGLLPRLLPRFRSRYPEVLVLVYSLDVAPQFEALAHGRIDVGFVRATHPVEGVELASLTPEPLVAAVAADSRYAAQDPLPLAELSKEPFILFRRQNAVEAFDAIVGACNRAGFSPNVLYEHADDQAALGLVASGMGVAVVPASTANLRLPGVCFRRIVPEERAAPLTAAWTATASSPQTANLLELVRELRDNFWELGS